MTILKIYDIIMGTNYVQYPPVINTIGNVTNTGATTDDDYDDDGKDLYHLCDGCTSDTLLCISLVGISGMFLFVAL